MVEDRNGGDSEGGSPTAARKLLSVIVPFRAEPSLPYFLVRLEDQLSQFPRHPALEFMVVDSGSSAQQREVCRDICARHGVKYVYHESEGQTFSIGTARNVGAQCAEGAAVTFLDVDLRVADDFWTRLLDVMSAYGISKHKKSFFVIPCLYLTEQGTQDFQEADPQTRFLDYFLLWLDGDKSLIQNMAPCSSVMCVDRLHYLSVGGHRPEFRGHGYEDFELYHRLLSAEGVLPRSDDYYSDKKTWETHTYNGFRSHFRLLGRPALLTNLFAVHLWHPRPKASPFYAAMPANREIWVDFFKEFDADGEHPEPLADLTHGTKRFLFFGQPRTNAARCLRNVFPSLGQPVFVSEHDFVDDAGEFLAADFQRMLQLHGIDQVLFPNPYGNDNREKAYVWCRENGFPYICYERGALPDSWFFDAGGFNADSKSYDEAHWNTPLTQEERAATLAYVRRTLIGDATLEVQGLRMNGDALRERLKTGGKKVLFVPLQRPSDTVIRKFAKQLKSYDDFLDFIDEAALLLKRAGWVVLCKRHPLEVHSKPLKHAKYVPEDTHFIDLLELADSVALVNSGVGVYAMLSGKPCHVFGEAFYSFEGVNRSASVSDANSFCDEVIAGHPVDLEKVYRFVHYLRMKFYSFGKPSTETIETKDGSLRSLTTGIDFYTIRVPGLPPVFYSQHGKAPIPTSAPRFEPFKLDLFYKRRGIGPAADEDGAGDAEQSVGRAPLGKKGVKLRKDPHAFFGDSRYTALRPLRHLFSRR